MLRRKKHGHGEAHGGVDPNGWMISYADMVTILLAMFIVLSTLAQDQTGISLYHGTGSYHKAVNSFGIPGLMSYTEKSVQQNHSGPRYSVDNPDPNSKPALPDQLHDGELEQFQGFLADLSKDNNVNKTERTEGRAAVDIHTKLNTTAPYLNEKQTSMLIPVLSLVRDPKYRAEIIVWAPTPADTAMTRSLKSAEQIRLELIEEISLPDELRDRVIAVCQPWRFKDVKRPIFSVVVSRVKPNP